MKRFSQNELWKLFFVQAYQIFEHFSGPCSNVVVISKSSVGKMSPKNWNCGHLNATQFACHSQLFSITNLLSWQGRCHIGIIIATTIIKSN